MPADHNDLIAYVDGLNLYHGLRQTMGHRWLWLDVVALVRSLRPDSHLVEVVYFTTITLDSPEAQSRQHIYLKALSSHGTGLVTIRYGRNQRRSHLCEHCGHKRVVYEEKETDVHLSAQFVADSIKGRMSEALIISGDGDYLPAIQIAQRSAPGILLSVAFPPGRRSKRIQAAFPSSFVIGEAKIRQSQLPETVQDTQWAYRRPTKWSNPLSS